MKFFSLSANRSLAIALLLGGTLGFSMSGITHAQYGTSGQGSSTGQGSGTTSTNGATSGTTKDGKDSGGYVDQKKKGERAKDTSPSNDPHVPDVRLGKDGKPTVSPSQEQGGSIGPN